MNKRNTAGLVAGIASLVILLAFALILIIPSTREVFKSLSAEHSEY